MSVAQNQTENWVVINGQGAIVEGPTSRDQAEAKKQTLTESQGQQGLRVTQLLTE